MLDPDKNRPDPQHRYSRGNTDIFLVDNKNMFG
jgi:hypothetical protein